MRTYSYKVNEEKGVVTCVLVTGNEYAPDVFVGIARCSKDDKFDETFGKTLARQRAILKANKHELKRLETVYPDKVMQQIENEFMHARARKFALQANIERLKAEIADNLALPDSEY